MGKKRYRKVIAVFTMLMISIQSASYATPNAYNPQIETNGAAPFQSLGKMRKEDNPTGLIENESLTEEGRLRSDIESVLPMLQDIFDNAYKKAEDDVKSKIIENGWDSEYTLQSFYDLKNPYTNMDLTRFIAAYATVVELGRNGKSLLSDVPLLIVNFEEGKTDVGASYGNITSFSVLDSDGLLRYYGYDPKDESIKKKVEYRIGKINDAMTEEQAKQSIFVKSPETISVSLDPSVFSHYGISEDISDARKAVIATALSLRGQVPYDWGGKTSKAGYDNTWWTYSNEKGRQNGLDCSGFVQWAYMTAGFPKDVTDKLISTYTMRQNFNTISEQELVPGDIGLLKDNDVGTNHCGIYLGDGIWVHCSSAYGTVVATPYNFRVFKRIIDDDSDILLSTPDDILYSSDSSFEDITGDGIEASDNDIYTFAQLIEHEVGGEGYNAWVAVAETVLNRVNSDSFPDDLMEVIYQPHQFSYVSEIKYITPRQEVIDVAKNVLSGHLKYFGNSNVLFFRNPMITSGIPSSEPSDWGDLPWYGAVGKTAFYLG